MTEQGIGTSVVEGRAMSGVLALLAGLIVADTVGGLSATRAHGRVGEHWLMLTGDQAQLAQQFYDTRQKTAQQIADLFGVPLTTVYNPLRKSTAVMA